MIADSVLIGRARVVRAGEVATTANGSAVARALLGMALFSGILFELTSADPLMDLGTYMHRGIGSWTGLPFPLTIVDVLLVLALFAVALGELMSPPRDRISPTELGMRLRGGWPVVLFTIAIIVGFTRGALGGGDAYVGVWELRFLLYVPMCYAIARASLRTPKHVAGLLRGGLLAAVLFAIEGAYRRIALIDTGQIGVVPEFAYEHEDVLFLAVFILLILGAHVFGAFRRVRVIGLLLTPLMIYTLMATERRSGSIIFMVGLIVIALTTLVVRRKAFFISAMPVLVITVLYLGVFWNAAGILGQPSRAIKSLYQPDPRDAQSNLYRELEKIDIDITIHSDPLLGIGFGQPFIMAVALPDMSWWDFWHYETHNSILWVWMKTGVIGYVLFWCMIGGAISRAAFAAKRLTDPTLRCAALFCLVAIVGTVVFAYVDLGLVSGRVMTLFGTALGILAVVERIDRSSAKPTLVRAKPTLVRA
jgi:hypothetical protein